jgi:lipopolysaccharide biosynthesis regulator YciM
MEINLTWIQDHLLTISVLAITLVLIYHYLIERDTGVKLSKRYRNSIYEAQSRIFLSATQYLISGNKDLAIREFLNAVDVNRETLETYFALGGLFRSNGDIEKAISIHRSLIARENISEGTRLRALKELALDFDKGGFVDRAIETYKDVLKINRDQHEVILSLCRIFENIEDWDQAYNYRIMLSKVGHEDQAETISHILVQKAKAHFDKGDLPKCADDLDDAFRFAPSVSAKILKMKLMISRGDLEQANFFLVEVLKEHPMFATFIFTSLEELPVNEQLRDRYMERLIVIRDYFLEIEDKDLISSPSVVLSKVRMLKTSNRFEEAMELLKVWVNNKDYSTEVLKAEYIKLLIDLGQIQEAMVQTHSFLDNLHQSLTRHFCRQCGYNSDNIFWRCPQCHEWETIQFRWKF